ncbi:hypothetical protein [Peribacillus sp. SCS-155]|uniref:hypothetical protein n=1 Tax=Peribacillus sedimenti TaxID=3115297 RepID=UPI003906BAE8
MMSANKKERNLVGEPLLSTGDSEAHFKEDTKNSKLTSIPKRGETLLGEDGITGRVR